MSESYYLYILPSFAMRFERTDPLVSKWELTNKGVSSPKEDPFKHYYSEYRKTVKKNDQNYSINFREYNKLKAITFTIKNLDENSRESWDNIDEIFSEHRRECGVKAISSSSSYMVRVFKNAADMVKENGNFDYIYTETIMKSELHRIDPLGYNIYLNLDPLVAKSVINDIITLLSLSKIAYYYVSPFLDGQPTDNYNDIIAAFWGYKSLLLGSSLFSMGKGITIYDNPCPNKSLCPSPRKNSSG